MKNSYLVLLLICFVACTSVDQYCVEGVSTVQNLEGRMLYLKVFQGNDMQIIDSAKVVHGKFTFRGEMDSVMMGNVFFKEQGIMPVVLEEGNVVVTLEDAIQSATGTPLNDSLHNFILQKTQIDAQLAELPHKESQMIMNGEDHKEIVEKLNDEARQLNEKSDHLITHFISSNYDNVLGSGVFMILTSSLEYPILNPQIEQIVSQATPHFLGHPYVQEYIKTAHENMEKLNEVK